MKRIILLAIVATLTLVSCKKERCYQCYAQGSRTPRNFCGDKQEKEQYVRGYAANGYTLTCYEKK